MCKRAGCSRCRGLSAVEMALVMPVLVLLVMGAIEFAMVFHVMHAMNQAAREGARALAVSGVTTAQAQQLTQDRLSSINATFTVTASLVPVASPPHQKAVVHVSVPRNAFSFSFFDALGDRSGTIDAQVTMRREE